MTRWCFRVMMIFDYCIDDDVVVVVVDDENGCDGDVVDGHGHDHGGHHRCDHHGTKFFFSLFYDDGDE